MTNKVEICGVNTSKLPVLSREEKNKLFIKIKNGDLQARETFVKGNLRLVLSVIKDLIIEVKTLTICFKSAV